MLSKNSYKIFLIISVASFEVTAADLYEFSKIRKSASQVHVARKIGNPHKTVLINNQGT